VVRIDKAAMDYYVRLTNFYHQFQAVGNNYNQAVKAIKTNFGEKRAYALLRMRCIYSLAKSANWESVRRSSTEGLSDMCSTGFSVFLLASGDVKQQVSNILKSVFSTYRFQSFGEYSALLSCFNIEDETGLGANLKGRLTTALSIP